MAAMEHPVRAGRLPAFLLALSLGIAALPCPSFAQLQPPDNIQVQPGCQQYLLTWNSVSGAAAYRVVVTDPPETLTVTTESATVAVTTLPTDREFRVSTIDGADVEGDRSGPRQGTGADAAPPDLLELPDIVVHVGEPFSILAQLANAPGSPAMLDTFQWYRDGAPLNVIGPQISSSTAQYSDAGVYTLRGCRRCCDSTTIVRLEVRPPILPMPQFLQASPGCQSLVVSWEPVVGAVGYRIVREDNNGTLHPPVDVTSPPYDDAGAPAVPRRYRVSAIDSFGKLGMEAGPTGQAGPGPGPLGAFGIGSDTVLVTGSNLLLQPSVAFAPGTTTYEWRRDGAPLANQSASSLQLSNLQPAQSGTYDCVACNPCGCVTSTPRQLLVADRPDAPASVVATAACSTASVTWTPVAGITQYRIERTPGFTGPPPPEPGPIVRVVTGTSFFDDDFFPPPNPTDVRYRIRAIGTVGLLSGPRSSNLVTPERIVPQIETNPTGRILVVGQRLSLHVGANVTPGGGAWQWRKNGIDISGANAPSYSIASVSPGDAADYSVSVCNLCGCDTSTVAVVSVCVPLDVSVPAGGSVVYANEGQPTVALPVNVAGATNLRWYRDGVALADGGDLGGTGTATLSIATPLVEDAGFYELRAASPCQTAARTVELRVAPCYDQPVITQQPPLSLVREPGQSVTFTVAATCCRPPTYQWVFRPIGAYEFSDVPGANQPSLTLSALGPTNAGSYMCVVSNRDRPRLSSISELTLLPTAVFTRVVATPVCGGSDVRWWANLPVSVVARVRATDCSSTPHTQTPASPTATAGSIFVPLASDEVGFADLVGTTAGAQVANSGCFGVAPKPLVPQMYASSGVSAAYAVGTVVGDAVVLRISANNSGCGAFDGTIVLSELEIAGIPGGAVQVDGTPAVGLGLPGALVGPGGRRDFPDLLVPVTIPASGVTVTHLYSGSLVLTGLDGVPIKIGFAGSFVLRPEGVTR